MSTCSLSYISQLGLKRSRKKTFNNIHIIRWFIQYLLKIYSLLNRWGVQIGQSRWWVCLENTMLSSHTAPTSPFPNSFWQIHFSRILCYHSLLIIILIITLIIVIGNSLEAVHTLAIIQCNCILAFVSTTNQNNVITSLLNIPHIWTLQWYFSCNTARQVTKTAIQSAHE